jgi:hypothetical protein
MRLRRWLLLFGLCSVWLGDATPAVRGEPPRVKISSIDVGMSAAGPVVLLKARGRGIPVFVDPIVAESINEALGGKKPPRPLTHDLMREILHSLDAKVTKVWITLKGDTYYADLTLFVDGHEKVFDSRSSDAIALAVRFEAPIFVGEDLLQSAGKPLPGGDQREL